MKLRKEQKDALKFFKEFDYLYLNGPRRSGKTTILQHIIGSMPGKRFLLVSPLGYKFYKICGYDKFKNCTFCPDLSPSNQQLVGYNYIVGEEIELHINTRPVICAYTKKVVEIRFKNYFTKKEMSKIKKEVPRHIYLSEFGQYG